MHSPTSPSTQGKIPSTHSPLMVRYPPLSLHPWQHTLHPKQDHENSFKGRTITQSSPNYPPQHFCHSPLRANYPLGSAALYPAPEVTDTSDTRANRITSAVIPALCWKLDMPPELPTSQLGGQAYTGDPSMLLNTCSVGQYMYAACQVARDKLHTGIQSIALCTPNTKGTSLYLVQDQLHSPRDF